MLVQLRTRDAARVSSSGSAEPVVTTVAREVALVVMPVHLPSMPSLAIATLAEGLRRIGHRVDVFPLHVTAAGDLGLADYEVIGAEDAWLHNVAEWCFSHPSITPGAGSIEAMRAHLRREKAPKKLLDLDLAKIRVGCDRLIEHWAASVDWRRYDLVGFSVMFQQLNASLRLAARIKEQSPRTRVVFGGSSMERPMGDAVLARYPWLDAVFSGYGDRSLPAYLQSLPPRQSEPITDDGPFDLDELPTPSFDEYLRAIDDAGLRGKVTPQILIETSRGCWYGEKHHCTFCGMNGVQMKFRQKSADRVFEEVQTLSRYGHRLWATDNILAMGFFKDLFPRMKQEGVKFPAFFEVKSNLRRDQLETIAELGITRLQPGIESLSTKLLARMRKGVSGVQNVWFLRASEELGVYNQWNVLYGFPREEKDEYRTFAEVVPLLAHLEPPTGCAKIHLLRFSPNHTQAGSLGFVDVRPVRSYAVAFGEHPRLPDQAYVFDHGYDDGRDPESYTADLNEACSEWQRLKAQIGAPRCEVLELAGVKVLYDTRKRGKVGRAVPRLHRLTEAEWALLEALESPMAAGKLEREWARAEPLAPLLDRFLREGWALSADDRLVRLVVVRKERRPDRELARVVALKLRALERWVRKRV
ncbi:MAG: RiPP maturation radical SAM C-methyltransferase [Polyangiales bacterium]